MRIRSATPDDAKAIAGRYNPYMFHTCILFK